MSTDEYKEWLKTLKVGDEVATKSGGVCRNNYMVRKVIRITPTGRINLSDGHQYKDGIYRDGTKYSHYRSEIIPITQEIRDIIERRELVNEINWDKLEKKLTLEQLRTVVEWQKAVKEE